MAWDAEISKPTPTDIPPQQATHPNASQTDPPTWNQTLRHTSVWGPFSFKSP